MMAQAASPAKVSNPAAGRGSAYVTALTTLAAARAGAQRPQPRRSVIAHSRVSRVPKQPPIISGP